MTEPSTCPWCGLRKKVYVRAGSELVCIDCVKKDAAMDDAWNQFVACFRPLMREGTDGD